MLVYYFMFSAIHKEALPMSEKKALFKCYCSDIIYDFGRFVVITTSQYCENHKDIIAEVFVLGLDTEELFQGNQIQYRYKMGDEKLVDFDLSYMENQALEHARKLISYFQQERYKIAREVEYLRKDFEFEECGKSAILSLKHAHDYENSLRRITEWTVNDELREYLELILSFPKLSIKPYPPQMA